VSAEDAPNAAYHEARELLGGFAGQVTHTASDRSDQLRGHAGAVNSRPWSNLMLMACCDRH